MVKDFKERAEGMLVGLAVGDALGAPMEFSFMSSSDIEMGELKCGAWTDDTSMALCIADSLIKRGGYDSYNIMSRFYDWAYYGYRAHPKARLDIGRQTLLALDDFEKDPVVKKGTPKTESAGNGCIMRLAPIIIANVFENKKYPTLEDGFKDGGIATKPGILEKNKICIRRENIEPVLKMARLSCRETHNSLMAEAVTEMFAAVLYNAMMGLSKNNILTNSFRFLFDEDLQEDAFEVYSQMGEAINDKEGRKFYDLGGYCLDTFLIAVWGLMNFRTFEEGMFAVIRLDGDTDTNAAVYGQLAGAYYGYKSIPKRWVKELYLSDEIKEIADKLLKMEKCPILRTRFEDVE